MSAAVLGAYVSLALLGLALILTFVRIVRGPSLADRVVALDLLSVLVAGIIVAWAVASRQTLYLDVALVVALITFLGTVALARYAERGEDDR